jgi:four helix bundle protein
MMGEGSGVSELGEELKRRTSEFALATIRMCNALPRSSVGRVLGDQVLRSATSVGANYREAFRGRSNAEFIAKMGDCLRELEETAYWFELLVDSGTFEAEKLVPLRQECDELTALFVSIIKRKRASSYAHHNS